MDPLPSDGSGLSLRETGQSSSKPKRPTKSKSSPKPEVTTEESKPPKRKPKKPKAKKDNSNQPPNANSTNSTNFTNSTNSTNPNKPTNNSTKSKTKSTKPKDKSTKTPKSKTKPKNSDPTKDYKYQQIKKLTKAFTPVTINGIPLATLCKQVQIAEEGEAFDKYLLNLITNQNDQSIYLSFIVTPSDPDFPFDLDCLKLSLCIPKEYPHKKLALPSIYILNDEIPRGFAINVELGFKKIAGLATGVDTDNKVPIAKEGDEFGDENEEFISLELMEGKGLLSQIKTLDKYLEVFFKQEKRKTIKIVRGAKSSKQSSNSPKEQSPTIPTPNPVEIVKSVVDTDKRNDLINHMTNKLQSQIKLFNKSDTHSKYKVFLPINIPEDLPQGWTNHGRLEIILTIPIEYPYGLLSIEIPRNFQSRVGRYPDFEYNLIHNFNSFEFPEKSLVSVLNYLSNNLNVFCLDKYEFKGYNDLVGTWSQLVTVA